MNDMSTLSITVEHANQALMLADWLKNIRFVREVTVDVDKTERGNANAIQKMLDTIKSEHLFSDIVDPVAYQKQIRDEWR